MQNALKEFCVEIDKNVLALQCYINQHYRQWYVDNRVWCGTKTKHGDDTFTL